MPRLLVPPVVLGLLAFASTAGASPSIRVVSPTAGPLSTDQPTLTVVYSSDDPGAPLDLLTLRILVNGSDWTGKFVQSAGSATYDVSAQDACAAGRITIEASIADVVGGLASASQPYDLVPTIRAIAPAVARPGDELTLEVVGLDPSAANNIAVFPSAFVRWPQGAEVAFSTVDRETKRGTVVVPAGAITGPVSVRVNDVVSAGGPNLTILGDFDTCGNGVGKMISLASGRMVVLTRYGYCALAGFEAQGAVTLQDPGEPMVLFSAAPQNGSVDIVTIAADKAGSGHAVISFRVLSNSPLILETIVNYKGTESHVAVTPGPFSAGADFDSEGNLYLTSWVGTSGSSADLLLVRLSAEDLARGGAIGYTTVSQLPVSDPVRIIRHAGLSVSCEGRAYIGIGTGARADFSWEGEVREIDLATGAVTDTMALNLGLVAGDFPLLDLALTGNPGELLGSSLVDEYDSDVEVWRGVMGQQAPTRVAFLPNNWQQTPLTVAPNGDVYIANPNGDSLLPLGYKVQVVDPCPGAACPPPRPQPYCNATPPAQIEILSFTTRWRPQKDTTTPIVVNFTAPKGYTPTALDMTDSTGALLAGQNISISGPTDPDADPGQYAITWSGPWSWTDSTTSQLRYQAAGNYTFKIRGTKADGTSLNSDPSKPCFGAAAGTPTCSVVSLVEVTALTMMDKPSTRGRVRNDTLGGPGGGWAIFPDARNPSPSDQVGDEDKLEILATVTPAVPEPRTQGAVTVYFRGLDLDDPSANTPPVDDEGFTYDNCLGGGCAVPSAGNVNGQNADTPVPVPLASGQLQVAVDFQVSARQGDNYRVAASTSSTWLGTNANGLSAKQDSAFGEVAHSSGGPVLDTGGAKGPQVSEMLTVWRTLHLEVDRFVSLNPSADQDALDAGPGRSFTNLTASELEDANAPDFSVPGGFTATPFVRYFDHPRVGDWVGADLTVAFHSADVYDVTASGFTTVTAGLKFGAPDLLAGLVPTQILNRGYRVSDEQVSSLETTHRLSLAQGLLTRAYISVVQLEQIQETSQIPLVIDPGAASFNRYISAFANYKLELPTVIPSSRSYWSTAVISAFNPDRPAALDPAVTRVSPQEVQSTVILGHTNNGLIYVNGTPSWKIRSSIFLEAMRDLSAKPPALLLSRLNPPGQLAPFGQILSRVTAHEILHQFGLQHDGAIMCSKINLTNSPLGDVMTEDQLKRVRRVELPTIPQEELQCR